MQAVPNAWSEESPHLATVVQQIFPSAPTRVERVPEGVSTYVYRIVFQEETFYLRVLPEEGASFSPEAAVHAHLRQLGVRVPEVIHMEPWNEVFQRSVMVTREVKGRPISQSPDLAPEELKAIMHEAGRDLAWINSLAVNGFGWIKREPSTSSLEAQWPTSRLFLLEYWKADLAYLARNTLDPGEATQLERVLSCYDTWLESHQSTLAHGDFDTTQIYQDGGRYTGIIDFGEIRGTDRWYDLGHFHVRDGGLLQQQLEPALVQGYEEVVALPPDYEPHIRFTSLLINVRALARSLQKRPPNPSTHHQLEVLRKDLTLLHPLAQEVD